ncbi:Alpha/beta hydrolase family protein [Mycobacterium basiliense]|uniref:Alpha/beta hydrolase family protein n=1 Tax=Mycobacterium basiliense TaxID=2094119 RepID=A0A447GCW1_9MYCO|nr:alpha/beta hydrolase [Mycobacterium basiliense]VDM88284.1 Alpha/beta hydrolase family protein [Mycobacterium basiliense]
MPVNLRGVTTVLLPGTGSDDDYVYRAFSGPLQGVGAVLVTPPPRPDHLIEGYRAALDEAARAGPICVGGVSIGAAVAVAWALAHPGRTRAVLAALPAWTGAPGAAPAAHAARHTAAQLRRDGLVTTTTQMRASSPRWLADELARSWQVQWPRLPDAMEEAAAYVAPSDAELAWLAVPLGVAAAADDPIHPLQVGLDWVRAAPRAALRTVTLAEIGADAAALGAACVAAVADA